MAIHAFILPLALMFGQQSASSKTGNTSMGSCSPIINSNPGVVNIRCSGLDPEVATELVQLVEQLTRLNKKIATNKHPKVVLDRMSQILAELKTLEAQAGNEKAVIASGTVIQQNTSGDCSPAIVGSGNINNCGISPKADRRIPESKKQEIVDLLKQRPSKVQLCAVVNDRESFAFAQDWYQLFDQAGWEIQERRIVPFMADIPWAGVQIAYSADKLSTPGAIVAIPSDEIGVILAKQALDRSQTTNITGDRNPEQDRELVVFRVGLNP